MCECGWLVQSWEQMEASHMSEWSPQYIYEGIHPTVKYYSTLQYMDTHTVQLE